LIKGAISRRVWKWNRPRMEGRGVVGRVPLRPDRKGDQPGGQSLAVLADHFALEGQVCRAGEREGEAADKPFRLARDDRLVRHGFPQLLRDRKRLVLGGLRFVGVDQLPRQVHPFRWIALHRNAHQRSPALRWCQSF